MKFLAFFRDLIFIFCFGPVPNLIRITHKPLKTPTITAFKENHQLIFPTSSRQSKNTGCAIIIL